MGDVSPLPSTASERWAFALKPPSWPKLLVPALLGQAIGVGATGSFDVIGFLIGLGFTVADLAYVVLLNDWGDESVDRVKRRMFPESCGPKTIPDGILEARSVFYAGLGAGALALVFAVLGQEFHGRPGLAVAGFACLGLFAAYTLPPVRLNYRGGGELLEMLGVGVALPWFNAYCQGGDPFPSGLAVLPAFALMSLASALASGLADEESDRIGGKRTFTTLLGNATVRGAVEQLVLAGALVWASMPIWAPGLLHPILLAVPVAVIVHHVGRLRRISGGASIGMFAGQRAYKEQLHFTIWRGTAVLAILWLVHALSGASLPGAAW